MRRTDKAQTFVVPGPPLPCAAAGNGGCKAQWMLDLPGKFTAQMEREDWGGGGVSSLGVGLDQRGPIVSVK